MKWLEFMDKYSPTETRPTPTTSMAMPRPQAMVQVLKQCGDNLTRENVMKQATSLKNFHTDLMLPGIKINTSADDLFPDRADAADEFQRPSLGAVRRRHHRRGRALGAVS